MLCVCIIFLRNQALQLLRGWGESPAEAAALGNPMCSGGRHATGSRGRGCEAADCSGPTGEMVPPDNTAVGVDVQLAISW